MKTLERMEGHLRTRMADLKKLKAEGRKIIGYTPGGYMPEELVYAAGAVPVCLIRGGDHVPVEVAGAYTSRWLDTFCRAQIGYKALKEDELYQIIDLLVVPITDQNMRAVADAWGCFFKETPLFTFAVPQRKTENGFQYYLHGLKRLMRKLEETTGNKITDEGIRKAIELSNREGQLLREISLMRKNPQPQVTGRHFARINHISFLVDKGLMVNTLETLTGELKEKKGDRKLQGTRILFTGSTLALGDYKMFDLIEKAEGEVVIEEFAEGIRHYWDTVKLNGDPIGALADKYFRRRVPPAWFHNSYQERSAYLCKIARDFSVDGVIWYQLMYRDAYDVEAFYFPRILEKETGLSMLKIESEYDAAEVGPFRTRVETFIETIRAKK